MFSLICHRTQFNRVFSRFDCNKIFHIPGSTASNHLSSFQLHDLHMESSSSRVFAGKGSGLGKILSSSRESTLALSAAGATPFVCSIASLCTASLLACAACIALRNIARNSSISVGGSMSRSSPKQISTPALAGQSVLPFTGSATMLNFSFLCI